MPQPSETLLYRPIGLYAVNSSLHTIQHLLVIQYRLIINIVILTAISGLPHEKNNLFHNPISLTSRSHKNWGGGTSISLESSLVRRFSSFWLGNNDD